MSELPRSAPGAHPSVRARFTDGATSSHARRLPHGQRDVRPTADGEDHPVALKGEPAGVTEIIGAPAPAPGAKREPPPAMAPGQRSSMSEAICRACERRIPRAGASIDTLPPKLIRGQPIPGVIAINVVVGGSDAPTRSEPIEAGLAVHNSATRGMLHVNGDTDGAECTTTTAVAHRRRVPPWAPRRAAAELLGTAHRGTELPLSEPRTPVPTARAQR